MGDSGKDDDIERLKKKVINNEKTITELKEQIHQLRSENKQLRDDHDKRIRDLEGKKGVLEKENENFKKRIKWLEDDVRYFSTKEGITDLQNKLQEKDDQLNDMKKSFRKEINEMKKLIQDSKQNEKKMEKEIRALKVDSEKKENKMEKMSKEMCAMIKDSEKKDNKMKMMSDDIGHFTNKAIENEKKLNATTKRIEKLEESQDRLYIGQMCTDIQEYIYRVVLPDYFEQEHSYHNPRVNDINENIDKLCKTHTRKQEAKQKWTNLQSKIGWQPIFVTFMDEFLKKRHEVAHPHPLRKGELEEIARSRLTGQKGLYCKMLIQVWEILIEQVTL